MSAVARELSISSSQLSKWIKDFEVFGNSSFPGRGVERLIDEQIEIKKLRKQLKDKELYLEI